MEDSTAAIVSSTPIRFAAPPDTRLVFSGPPKALTGNISVVNTGSEKEKIRAVGLTSASLKGAASEPLVQASLIAKLYPGEQANVPGMIALDATTPPGTYDLQVSIGDTTMPATAYVSEVVDLRIHPATITILAGAGSSYKKTFTAENAGNMNLPTGAQCETPIFESYDLVSAMLMGLHKADRTSAETLTKGLLEEWANLQVGTLIINRESVVLRPGLKQNFEVEFLLPAEMKPLRHYNAVVQLYNATISVDIYTTAKAGNNSETGPSTPIR